MGRILWAQIEALHEKGAISTRETYAESGKMTVGAVLPHLQQFGGVRRFLEMGNVFIDRGIIYTIFAGKPGKCKWFNYKGYVRDCSQIKADNIIFSYPPDFRHIPRAKGRIFIFVNAGGKYIKGYKSRYGKYPFMANNRVFKKYFPKLHLIEGGVNVHQFKPLEKRPSNSQSVRILYYVARGSHKGSEFIRHELSGLKGIELVGLQGLSDDKLAKMYRTGDFFVGWESRLGWSNTIAEALASGLTVITNGFNCEPFMDKVIKVKSLRKFFSNAENLKIRKPCSMEDFSWEITVDKMMNIFRHYRRHKK